MSLADLEWTRLQDAPDVLLNQETWQRLVEIQGSKEEALGCLNSMGNFFHLSGNRGLSGSEQCRTSLLEELKTAIACGQFVVEGFPPNGVSARTRFNSEMAEALKFDFASGKVRISGQMYTKVLVARAAPTNDQVVEEVAHELQRLDLVTYRGKTARKISLSDAPELFFNPVLWSCVKEACRDLPQALATVGQTAILCARMADDESPVMSAAYKLNDDFRRRMVAGELHATGIHKSLPQAQDIAPELWRDADLDFARSTVKCGEHKFSHVMIGYIPEPPEAVRTVADMTLWLGEQRANGTTKKIHLMTLAKVKFADRYQVRLFNKAFADVFKHTKGRPKSVT